MGLQLWRRGEGVTNLKLYLSSSMKLVFLLPTCWCSSSLNASALPPYMLVLLLTTCWYSSSLHSGDLLPNYAGTVLILPTF